MIFSAVNDDRFLLCAVHKNYLRIAAIFLVSRNFLMFLAPIPFADLPSSRRFPIASRCVPVFKSGQLLYTSLVNDFLVIRPPLS